MPAKFVPAPPLPAPAASALLPGARQGRDPARAIKRGPSRLPRELVAATQRDRLYDALVHTVAEHGYASATVTDICRAAGVTRPAFYVHFDGKEGAFLAAYRHGADVVIRMMEHAHSQAPDWLEGVRAGLKVLLEVLASVPAFATMAIVEIEAVGPAARREREELLRRVSRFFIDAPPPPGPLPACALVDTVVGGVYSAVYRQVAAGGAERLSDLLPVLAYFVLTPFLGPERAVEAGARTAALPPAVAPRAPLFSHSGRPMDQGPYY
jgi:AcrR family transcriptional regulator